MKILLVTPSYFPIVGGSEVLTKDLCSRLNAAGIHADIMTFNMDEKWKPHWRRETGKNGAVNIFKEAAFPAARCPVFFPFAAFRLNVFPNPLFTEKLKEYDIIHFVGEPDLSLPFLSLFFKKPKLMECVGIFRKGGIYKYYVHDRPFVGALFRKVFPKIANRFIVSSIEEQQLLTELGVPEKKVAILPTGTDTSTFKPGQFKKAENMLLFVGRIVPIKGLHTLLQALQFIEVPTELNVIGPSENTPYFNKIVRAAQKMNQSGPHRVNLLGLLGTAELAVWYQKATLVVCPYEYETYSNVVREALACATPVVTTGSHMFNNSDDGIVTTSNNPTSLGTAITNLLKCSEERARLGRQGRKIIVERCSWDSVIKEYIILYQETLSHLDSTRKPNTSNP
jgi:glycosyltransferase involved in cell wall biosynthesis